MFSLELQETGKDEWPRAQSVIILPAFIGKGQVKKRCSRSLRSRRLGDDKTYKM